jgi:hypothetical protein
MLKHIGRMVRNGRKVIVEYNVKENMMKRYLQI